MDFGSPTNLAGLPEDRACLGRRYRDVKMKVCSVHMSVRLILPDQQDLRMPFTLTFHLKDGISVCPSFHLPVPSTPIDFYDWTEGTGPLLRGVRSQERVFGGLPLVLCHDFTLQAAPSVSKEL